jgi:dTDP-D-glucose 4,6-dehydratase
LNEWFKASNESGIDRNVLQAKAIEIVNRDHETNPDRKRYYTAIIDLDPLFGFTQDELDANLAKGLIYKTDVVIHNNTKSFVDRAMAGNKNFLDLPKQEKLAVLKVFAEELIKSEAPKVEPLQPVEFA